ncbi:MAG: SufE family protein [Dysgonamonadaceae bacterium]|nr:SufE family protein [Dysgonamonadaceae bacterium]
MTIHETQDKLIDHLFLFDNWTDRFNFLISESENLPPQCPGQLLHHRIEGCQSQTCFHAYRNESCLIVEGWSNSPVMGGIIVSIIKVFNLSKIDELKNADIYFHTKSGLVDNLTPMRRAALEEIIRRISILSRQT